MSWSILAPVISACLSLSYAGMLFNLASEKESALDKVLYMVEGLLLVFVAAVSFATAILEVAP